MITQMGYFCWAPMIGTLSSLIRSCTTRPPLKEGYRYVPVKTGTYPTQVTTLVVGWCRTR
eukprot:scaffold219634_cov56-Attheya_sp.AAC.3